MSLESGSLVPFRVDHTELWGECTETATHVGEDGGDSMEPGVVGGDQAGWGKGWGGRWGWGENWASRRGLCSDLGEVMSLLQDRTVFVRKRLPVQGLISGAWGRSLGPPSSPSSRALHHVPLLTGKQSQARSSESDWDGGGPWPGVGMEVVPRD